MPCFGKNCNQDSSNSRNPTSNFGPYYHGPYQTQIGNGYYNGEWAWPSAPSGDRPRYVSTSPNVGASTSRDRNAVPTRQVSTGHRRSRHGWNKNRGAHTAGQSFRRQANYNQYRRNRK